MPTRGIQIIGIHDDSLRNLLAFEPVVKYEEYNLSYNPVDMLPLDIFFLGTESAKAIVFEGKRTGIVHNFTLDVDLGYNYIENFGGVLMGIW